MGKLKDLLEKPKQRTRFKKQIHQKKISRDINSFFQSKNGEIRKNKKLKPKWIKGEIKS